MDRATASPCPAPAGAGFFYPSTASGGRRHLLGLEGLTRDAVLDLLDAARLYRDRLGAGRWKSDALAGVAVLVTAGQITIPLGVGTNACAVRSVQVTLL